MARSESETRDPRLRPFRVAAYVFYLLVVSSFSLLVIYNVFSSVFAMSPGRRPPAEPTYTVRECLDGLDQLWRELDGQRRDFTLRTPVRRVDQEWTRFRVGWIERLRELESHCAVESQSRQQLKEIFSRFDDVMDLYTTHAVKFAGEIGGAVDELQRALGEARRDPAAGRLP